ncbi:MAG TPA: IclR family transcriptional regulator [Propionibacteriaceae bacterium]|nr:IclR family transcriptional regulator [Propionibacteriaceae bacterium]
MAEGVQSVDRVFGLLEHLADGGGSLSLSELAARSHLPMPTIHRLIRSLVNQGYVRQETSKRYALGPRLIRLGESASRMLGSWAMPYLVELVDTYGETTNMAMLEGDACVYVAQVPSPRAMRMFTEVGRFVMPHCTGVGKAILSTLPDPDVRALLTRTGMPPRTEHTITSPDAMIAALGTVRKQGYAVDDGEQELGVRCVAVPIRGLPFRAALSVSGPSSRVTADQVPLIAPDIQAAADRVRLAFHAMS